MMLAGLLTVLAVLAIFFKLDTTTQQRLLGYDVPLDIAITLFLAWIFAGTYSGMMTAIVGGLAFSIVLAITKLFLGYQRFNFKHKRWIRMNT